MESAAPASVPQRQTWMRNWRRTGRSRERIGLKFAMDFFDLFNHPNFNSSALEGTGYAPATLTCGSAACGPTNPSRLVTAQSTVTALEPCLPYRLDAATGNCNIASSSRSSGLSNYNRNGGASVQAPPFSFSRIGPVFLS